ncbi:endonuclease [Microbulbifer yueqingensis]|uniref:Deoxyribonuclease-1 n=1 Tax=Microbulbifer yueqingensis TaxID=658219 RepID=A0A1G9ANU6_9GAMM|nr:endonuclease [Microbulbifer yueqingensis]SDK29056.1 deoxyribonuclease-1 [Microbulbifer yueqingensis]
MRLALFVLFLFPVYVGAHGGGLDARGCHNDRARAEYHCHRKAGDNESQSASPLLQSKQAAAPRGHSIRSFRQAKGVLRDEVYASPDTHYGFYSNCRFAAEGKKLVPDWSSCGFSPRKNANRAGRIEWEHVVPAWAIGHQRQCWQQGGRRNCTRSDPLFAMAEADLHNLVPAIGELNGDRSNYRFMEFGKGGGYPSGQYGAVEFRVDFKQRAVEPPRHRRGDIARIYMYMADTYGLSISPAQRKLFAAWNRADPVDVPECERDRRIAHSQGNHNPFVVASCR